MFKVAILLTLALSANAEISAHDALEILKTDSTIVNKFNYEIPSLNSLHEHTFFHEYFNSYKINDGESNTTEKDGYLIQIENNASVFFDFNELENYGKTDFKLPLGALKQIEEDRFSDVLIKSKLTEKQLNALKILKSLCSQHDINAIRILADIYTFGFYDVKVNLPKAQELYLRILELNSDVKTESHANFMLGVFYSTGLFGKIEKNVAKGLIHYNFAADVGNIQAQMALAHKYMFGINVVEDSNTAAYYFSSVKQKIENYLSSFMTNIPNDLGNDYKDLIFSHNFDKFNIRWTDLVGGLYGDHSSQAANSLRFFETFKDYDQIKNFNINGGFTDDSEEYSLGDDELLDAYSMLYFGAQKNYNGDYLHARNYEKAFNLAQICVQNGILEPGINEIFKDFQKEQTILKSNVKSNEDSSFYVKFSFDTSSPLEIFIGHCSQYLGHMYLRGEGTEINYEKAYLYTLFGKKLSSTQSFVNDEGIMKFYGLGTEKDVIEASKIFKDNYKYASSRYYTAITMIDAVKEKQPNKNFDLIDSDIYSMLSSSAPYFILSKRKILDLYEAGLTEIKIDSVVAYYNSYLKLFDFLYFDFKIPFYAFINANPNDTTSNNLWTSLVGMSIGSELGYENAQSSLGSILYPTVGDFNSRKIRENLETYEEIYTAKRYEEAIGYFELSALHANRDSMNFLGDLYYNGLYSNPSVNDDPLWCKSWWTYILPISGESEYYENNKLFKILKDLSNSIVNLLFTLRTKLKMKVKYTGDNELAIIPRDLSRAMTYYHDAASKGSHMGSYNVGWAYEYGVGVAQDLHLAKRYYDSALTRSNVGYLPVKLAVLRVKFKAMMWNLLGFDGRGVKELEMDGKTWKQRLMMIIGWVNNAE